MCSVAICKHFRFLNFSYTFSNSEVYLKYAFLNLCICFLTQKYTWSRHFLSVIWLPHSQLWPIIEGTASLTWCESMHYSVSTQSRPRHMRHVIAYAHLQTCLNLLKHAFCWTAKMDMNPLRQAIFCMPRLYS